MRAALRTIPLAMVLLVPALVRADLCSRCADGVHIMSVGKCSACGGETASGAFKLCRACSRRLNQCENCRAALGPAGDAVTHPATQPADRPEAKKDLDALVEALRKKMPGTWELAGVQGGQVTPVVNRAEGTEIRLQRKGYEPLHWKQGKGGEVRLWLMAGDYEPGQPPEGGQVGPPWCLGHCLGRQVYVWGAGDDWARWQADVREVLRAADPNFPTSRFAPDKVDPDVSGRYQWSEWRYEYRIAAKGSRSEMRQGTLTFDGKPVEASEIDRIQTPWGLMQYHGPNGWDRGWLLQRTYGQPIDAGKGSLIIPEQAREREKALLAGIETFRLSLTYLDPKETPYYLEFSVPRPTGSDSPFRQHQQVTKPDAEKIIRRLAEAGFLVRATPGWAPNEMRDLPAGPGYVLQLAAGTDEQFVGLLEDLGWGPPMLGRLEELRKGMSGPAGEKMDILLGILRGLRRE